MNLLKQTALILGLSSMSIGVWVLYRDLKNKISILFAALCCAISIWALSFVSHVTLGGRLSHDIHLFFNLVLSPLAVLLLAKLFLKRGDRVSRVLFLISFTGACVLGLINSLSILDGPSIRTFIEFWPVWILIQYLYVLGQDIIYHRVISSEYFSPLRKWIFYSGLGLSLAICTFDHIPQLGLLIPALGNILLTFYLIFMSQLLVPQKLFRIEALISRFFAVLILSLLITGFFALLYSYISETFPLFLLNSFLISFLVLSLWNPLLLLLRYLTDHFFINSAEVQKRKNERFIAQLSASSRMDEIHEHVQQYFNQIFDAAEIKLIFDEQGIELPGEIEFYLEKISQKNHVRVLHRKILEMERDQVFSSDRKSEIELVLRYLNIQSADVIFPIRTHNKRVGLILITVNAPLEESSTLAQFSRIQDLIPEVGLALVRVNQIEKAKEIERLALLGEMSAGLAHEIRNPLGAIQGAVGLLEKNSNPWVKMIEDEVSRLNRLVSQFLDFSSESQESPAKVELNSALEKVIQRLSLSKGRVEIIPHVSPVSVEVVPDHFQQVVINLVQNANKATEGKADASVKIRVNRFGFTVEDNGMGMSPEVKNNAFKPFFTSFKEGTGLGLAICHRLVHLNGGRISLTSTLGQGTSVTVEFKHAR